MSLIVIAYRAGAVEDAGARVDPALTAPRNDLFGFEFCRSELWGAPIVRDLGCAVLPSLAKTDIYAEDIATIDQLEAEARTILANLSSIEASTGYLADFVEARIENLLAVIALVRSSPPGTLGVHIG